MHKLAAALFALGYLLIILCIDFPGDFWRKLPPRTNTQLHVMLWLGVLALLIASFVAFP